MSKRDQDQIDVAAEARKQLEAISQELPGDVTQRLQQARRQAMASVDEPRPWRINWVAGGALASILLAVTVLTTTFNATAPFPLVSDPDEFAAAQDLELLEELEFIAWMIEVDDDQSG